jgi:predicted alpha/beta hydrolase family esterase
MKGELLAHKVPAETVRMPNTDFPKADEWVAAIRKAVGTPDEDVYLVGHSLGCMAILRYLESLSGGEKIGGILFVSGFSRSIGISYMDDFFAEPLNYDLIASRVDKKIFFQSDDDPYVPMSEGKNLEEKLGGTLNILEGAGHVTQSSGFSAFTAGLEALREMMQE